MNKRARAVRLHIMVSCDELDEIKKRMEELAVLNTSSYIRRMATTGYAIQIYLSPVKELVSLQRRCVNNLNQIARHEDTNGVYQEEISALKKGAATGVTMKVSEKGALSVYGMGRFPVTLYKEQWLKLISMGDEIKAFIEANNESLKSKGE